MSREECRVATVRSISQQLCRRSRGERGRTYRVRETKSMTIMKIMKQVHTSHVIGDEGGSHVGGWRFGRTR